MVYEQQPNRALGYPVTAEDWNKIQENLSNTAPAKADRAGQLFVSNAQGSIIVINPPSGLGTGRFVLHIAADGTYGWIDEQSLVPSSGNLTNDSITPALLHTTNDPADNRLLSYDSASQLFSWVDPLSFSIDAGSIGTTELADGSVTEPKLASDSVSATKIKTSNTPSDEYVLAYDDSGNLKWVAQVAEFVLSEGDITTEFLADAAVTHDKLAHDSVDTDNLVDNAVENEKIDDNAIALRHISADNGSFENAVIGVNAANDGLEFKIQSAGDGGNVNTDIELIQTVAHRYTRDLGDAFVEAGLDFQLVNAANELLSLNLPLPSVDNKDVIWMAEVPAGSTPAIQWFTVTGAEWNASAAGDLGTEIAENQPPISTFQINQEGTYRIFKLTNGQVGVLTTLGTIQQNLPSLDFFIYVFKGNIMERIAAVAGISEADANVLITNALNNYVIPDNTIEESQLKIVNDPETGKVIGYNSNDELEWQEVVSDIPENSIEESQLKIRNDPSNGKVLKYITDSLSWENDNAGSGGSGSGVGIELVLQGQTNTSTDTLFSPFMDPMPPDDEIEDNDIFLFIALRNRLFNDFRFVGHYEDHFFGREWKQLREVTDFMVGASEDHISFTTPFGNIIYSKGANNHIITAPPLEEAWDIYVFKLGGSSSGGSDLTPRTKQEVLDFIDEALTGDSSQTYSNIVYPQRQYLGTSDLSKTFETYETDRTLTITDAGHVTLTAIPNRGTFDNKTITAILEVRDPDDDVVVRRQLSVQNPKDVSFDVDQSGKVYTFRLIVNKHGTEQAHTELGMTLGNITVTQGEQFREDLEALAGRVSDEHTDHFIQDIADVDVKAEANADAITANETAIGENKTNIQTNLDSLANKLEDSDFNDKREVINAKFENATEINETVEYKTPAYTTNDTFVIASSGVFLQNRPNFYDYPDDNNSVLDPKTPAIGGVAQVVNEVDGGLHVTMEQDILTDTYAVKENQFDGSISNGLAFIHEGILTGPGIDAAECTINLPFEDNNNLVLSYRFSVNSSGRASLLALKRADNGEFFNVFLIDDHKLKGLSYQEGSSYVRNYRQRLHSSGIITRTYEHPDELEHFEWEVGTDATEDIGTYTVRANITSNGIDFGDDTLDIEVTNLGTYKNGTGHFTANNGHTFSYEYEYRPASLNRSGQNTIGLSMNVNPATHEQPIPLDVWQVHVQVTREVSETVTVPGGVTEADRGYTFEAGKVYDAFIHENPNDSRHRWRITLFNVTDSTEDSYNVGTLYSEDAVDTSQIRLGGGAIAYQNIQVSQIQRTLSETDSLISSFDENNFSKFTKLWGFYREPTISEIDVHGIQNALPDIGSNPEISHFVLATSEGSVRQVVLPPRTTYRTVRAYVVDNRDNKNEYIEINLTAKHLHIIANPSFALFQQNGIVLRYTAGGIFDPATQDRNPTRSLTIETEGAVSYHCVEVIL